MPMTEPTVKLLPSGENLPSYGSFIVNFSKEYTPNSKNFLISCLVLKFQRQIVPPSLPVMRTSSIFGWGARTKVNVPKLICLFFAKF